MIYSTINRTTVIANNNFAIVFPGQGSQSIGMLAELAAGYPQVGVTFAEASEVLGYDLWELVQNGRQVSRSGVSGSRTAVCNRR
jgi:malonyl CoA-acyl carrier protein transacylase